ncbi:ABC transporter ATP-binding protein [Roseovarius sp. 2305UL8-3]|uniref:ABC transporter ATP-binding protein n=1 Tax=Roseovarius conchicola TaxID=3121636 RepID=UPI003527E28D
MSLSIHDFSVSYGPTQILSGITDIWPAGQVTALIGCNGAGKTTLLKAMAGLQASDGEVALSGASLAPAERRHQIGYMPQDLGAISSLTVLEVVLLGRVGTLKMRVPSDFVEQAMAALEVFGLTGLRARGLDEISGGQRQLVFLAQALFRAPKVLLLDEPTAALDLRHQLLALERLCDHAASTDTIIGVAMHDLNLAAQFADRFLALQWGRAVTSGTATQVLTPDTLSLMYGIKAEVSEGQDGCLRIYPLRQRS